MEKKKIGGAKRIASLIMLVVMMFTLIPTEAFAVEAGQPSYDNFEDIETSDVAIDGVLSVGNADEFTTTNPAFAKQTGWHQILGQQRQTDMITYTGKFNFGTGRGTGLVENILPGEFSLRWNSKAILSDGTRADIILTTSEIKVNLKNPSKPTDANTNYLVTILKENTVNAEGEVCLPSAISSKYEENADLVVGPYLGLSVKFTLKVVKSGTNTPIDAKYKGINLAFIDIDTRDVLSTNVTDFTDDGTDNNKENNLIAGSGRLAESIEFTSSSNVNGPVHLASNTPVNGNARNQSLVIAVSGNNGGTRYKANPEKMTDKSIRNKYSDNTTYWSGIIVNVKPQESSFYWTGTSCATNILMQPKGPIIATAGAGGSIEKPGKTEYPLGGKTTYDYTPDAGYRVKSLTVNGEPVEFDKNGGTYTFEKIYFNPLVNVLSDDTQGEAFQEPLTIDVRFEKIPDHTITTNATNGTIDPNATVNHGGNKTINYSPSEGYKLKSVTVDGSAVNISTYPTSYTFSNVTADHDIKVVYEKIKYNITTNATNGTIDPNTTVEHGGNKTINYTPNSGYSLKSVTVDGTAVNKNQYPNSYSFANVTADHDIKVVYEKLKYNITTNVTNGTIDPDTAAEYGETKTITYSPNSGYKLKSVTVDGSPVDISAYPNSYTFSNIKENHDIKVVYEKLKYKITTDATNGTIDDNATVEYGASKTINYAPNEGYTLKSVTVDGKEVDITQYPSSYSFKNVTKNHDIKVVYEKLKYGIATNVTNGTITPYQTAEYGDNKTISYEPNEGYKLRSVTVDGKAVDITKYPSSYTFSNIKANHDVKVVYELKSFDITTSVEHGTIDPDVTKDYGTSETIHYAPESDQYKLKSVTVDISKYPTEYPFNNIKADHTIDVKFVRKDFTVTYTSDEGGQITGLKEEWKDPNENPTGTTQSDKNMYRFSHYVANVPVTLKDGKTIAAGKAITPGQIPNVVVNSDIEFKAIHDKLFNVNYKATEGGVVTGKTHEIRSAKEKPTGSMAEPRDGYQFRFWTDEDGNVITMDEIMQIKLNKDRTFTAVFEKIPNVSAEKLADKEVYNVDEDIVYTIKVKQDVDGAIARNVVITDVLPNGVSFASDVQVIGASGTASVSGNTLTVSFSELGNEEAWIMFTAHADKEIVMTPELLNTVQVDVENGEDPEDPSVTVGRTVKVTTLIVNGEITPSEERIPVGSNKTIEYTPQEGYMITHIYVNGVEEDVKDYPESFSFNNLVDNNDISVICERIPYEIETEVVNGTIVGGGTVYWGDDREVSYSPEEGFQLLSVEVDGKLVDGFESSYPFKNVRENHSIRVIYERIPELKVEKVSDRENYNVGDEITYTVTISQVVNGAEARDILITDAISEGAEYVEGSLEGIEVVSESETGYTARIDSLTDSITYTYKAIAKEEKEGIVNTVVAISPNTPNEGRDETTVNAYIPVASVNKAVDKEEALYGDILTYTITITNEKPGSELRDVVLKDVLPEGLEIIPESVMVDGESLFNEPADEAEGLPEEELSGDLEEEPEDMAEVEAAPAEEDENSLYLGTIADSVVITFQAKVTAKNGTITNEVEVTSNAEPVADSVSTEIISPVLSVVKGASTHEAVIGDTVSYAINVRSENTPAVNAVVTDVIPSGLEMDVESIRIEGAEGEIVFKDGTLEVTFESVEKATIFYTVKVVVNGAELKNIATFTSENNPGDPISEDEDLVVNRLYTVTFVDGCENTLKVEDRIPLHGAATAPEVPDRKGFKFTGWDIEFNDITEDITVTAQWEPVFTVTFVDGFGETLKVQEEVPMHGKGEAPKDPKKAGYIFKGWDVEFDDITGDLTVTAKWEAVKESLIVTGDNNNLMLYAGLSAMSLVGLLGLKKRQKAK